ncbi:HD domain-containing protein [Streptomyces sp. B1866]|uniref:HD domain-containing protein n=1 Tax=Streptomyces sp. B1866 TaxID=3075431 RepID=UPI00289292DB|nr:HD domain-containing protein [Streptomyces sp. B1866]MDT3398557.1 HD domain-containing protein [Streptomyces sp. B1866]
MSTPLPTGSLVELAARKQLPHHQFTDHATLRWIESNRPDFPDDSPLLLRSASQRLLHRCALPAHWLAEPKTTDSLHGIRHGMRTAVLAALLAESAGMDEEDTATLIVAAAVHDCRRLHDKDDRGHGARAARWLTENQDTVWSHFGLTPIPRHVGRAAVAVRLHDLPYAAFSADDRADHARSEQISDLLKAADALDRYRLPKLSWWPDSAHVRANAFDQLRTTAFDLVVSSEAAHLAGAESAEAVFTALEQRELIT